MEGTRIIFVPESNLAWEGIHVQHALHKANIPDVCSMIEDDNRAGVKINNNSKKLMTLAFNTKLLERSVYFHKDFKCIGEDNTPEDMKQEIIIQLRNFSRILTPSRDIHKPPKETYGGKSGHGYDDHVIAVVLNHVMKNRFFNTPETYGNFY